MMYNVATGRAIGPVRPMPYGGYLMIRQLHVSPLPALVRYAMVAPGWPCLAAIGARSRRAWERSTSRASAEQMIV